MDTNILAVIIQEGSKIASEFLRQRKTSITAQPVDLERFINESELRFKPLISSPEENIQPNGSDRAVIKINTELGYVPPPPEVVVEEKKATTIATGCVPCMPPDSLIWGNPGIKEISKVAIGSRVLDREGNYTKVLRASQRPYIGDLIEITIPGQNTPIRLTPNHRVLALKGIGCKRNHGITLCFPKEITCSWASG